MRENDKNCSDFCPKIIKRMYLIETDDGSHSIHSEKYGVTYHSTHGAIAESQHIFINAGLRFKAALQKDIAILETGLGTGLNAFMTLLEADKRNLIVNYVGLEIFPLEIEQFKLLNYPIKLNVIDRCDDFLNLHTCEWEKATQISDNFIFEKRKTPIEFVAFENVFDIVYFDAFAPQEQPELWGENVIGRMYKALKADGILVTYCAQGEFKRTLKKVGFQVERLHGPPGKREITRATKII
jgi:tRNA U34 5-methylaminomethyl-2-thiouridine-forming methyltransferase MnmC